MTEITNENTPNTPAKNYPTIYATYLDSLQNVTPEFGNEVLVKTPLQIMAQNMTVPCIIDSDIPFNQDNKYMHDDRDIDYNISQRKKLTFFWDSVATGYDIPCIYVRFKDAPVVEGGNPVPIYGKIPIPEGVGSVFLPDSFVLGRDFYLTATYTLRRIDQYTYEPVAIMNQELRYDIPEDDKTIVLFVVNIDTLNGTTANPAPRYPRIRGDVNTTISLLGGFESVIFTPLSRYITARNYVKPRFEPYMINTMWFGGNGLGIDGYPKGSVLYNSSGTTQYVSLIDDNKTPIDETNGLNFAGIAHWQQLGVFLDVRDDEVTGDVSIGGRVPDTNVEGSNNLTTFNVSSQMATPALPDKDPRPNYIMTAEEEAGQGSIPIKPYSVLRLKDLTLLGMGLRGVFVTNNVTVSYTSTPSGDSIWRNDLRCAFACDGNQNIIMNFPFADGGNIADPSGTKYTLINHANISPTAEELYVNGLTSISGVVSYPIGQYTFCITMYSTKPLVSAN
jgi:hypothetical protein